MNKKDLLAYAVLALAVIGVFGGILHMSDGNGFGSAAIVVGLGLVVVAFRLMTTARPSTE